MEIIEKEPKSTNFLTLRLIVVWCGISTCTEVELGNTRLMQIQLVLLGSWPHACMLRAAQGAWDAVC